MPAYLLVEAKVSDAAAYEEYKKLAQLAVAEHGGRYLARGGQIEMLEGVWSKPERLVIIEFDSLEQAKKFYDSPTYREARAARKDAADVNMLIVDGIR